MGQQQLDMRPSPLAQVGQATRIEQSRAEAEVLAAVMAAKQFPRNIEAARAEMQRACQSPSVAETAFFDFNRGDGSVRGETIHLAKELALIWGNLDFGVMELSRDDAAGRSEVLAFAKDLERNTRSSAIFISPHKRDVKGGPKDLASLRDVYENNANMGARRLREAIWAVLPNWFRAEASAICRQTLSQNKPGQTWEQRVDGLVAMYGKVGVPLALLETKVKRPLGSWGETEVVDLEITYRSVGNGTIKRDEAFPPVVATAADVIASTPITTLPTTPPAAAEQQTFTEAEQAAAVADLYAAGAEAGVEKDMVVAEYFDDHGHEPELGSVPNLRAAAARARTSAAVE